MADNDTRQCPFCKEQINREATKCKYCGSRVEPTRPEHGGKCPFCKESINPEALICKHCKSNLQLSRGCSCSNEIPFGAAPPNFEGLSGGRLQSPFSSAMRKPECFSWCSGSTLICACPVYIPGFGWGYVFYTCGTCINDPILTAFESPVNLK
jgi:hypothetical protein